jgi:tetratricopeptide (TPR) repeat protein
MATLARSHVTRARRLAGALCSVLFGLALLEGLLRLAGVGFLWVQNARNQDALDRPGTYRVLCLGESTTALGGPTAYPAQLEQILNDTVGGERFTVVNRGVPGINSAGILADLPGNLDRYRPHAVVAMMGINDRPGIEARFQVGDSWRVVKLFKLLLVLARERGEDVPDPCAPCSSHCRPGRRPLDFASRSALQDRVRIRQGRRPDDPARLLDLTTLQLEAGKFSAAERSARRVLGVEPNSVQGLLTLAEAQVMQGHFDDADAAFRRALEIAPDSEMVRCKGASLYALTRRFDDAAAALAEVLERNGHHEHTRGYLSSVELFRAGVYEREGRLDEAERALTKLLEAGGRPSLIYGQLGRIAEKQGRMEHARRYRERSVEESVVASGISTRRTYRALEAELDRRGILLVALQYPLRPLSALKSLLADQPGVLFVDAERPFRDALEHAPYEHYFSDRFAGDFGHFTPAGARLLADQVAGAILRYAGDGNERNVAILDTSRRPASDTLVLECVAGTTPARLEGMLIYGAQVPPPRHETLGFESSDEAANEGNRVAFGIDLRGRTATTGVGRLSPDHDQIRLTGVTPARVGVRFAGKADERLRLIGPAGATLPTDGTGIELEDVTTRAFLSRVEAGRRPVCRFYRVRGRSEWSASARP